ncbi:hypothetical protein N9C70_03875 [Flavobacteriales bacterium]|nr:hypothetical protein [Flavobacteriales bacterium]
MPRNHRGAALYTTYRTALLSSFLVLLGSSQVLYAQSLGEGAIAFTGVEAVNDYDFAFVAIQEIPAATVIYFASDGGWTGGSVGDSGKRIQWTSPSGGLQPGDRVEFLNPKDNSNLGVSSGAATVPGGSNGDWSIKKEGLYAYVGSSISTSAPTFLAFFATDNGVGYDIPSIEGQALDLRDDEGDDAGWDDAVTAFSSPAAMLVAMSEYQSQSDLWDDNNDFNSSSFTVTGVDVLHETFNNDASFTKSNQTTFFGGNDDDYYGIWDEYGADDDFDGESTPPSGDIHDFKDFSGNCLVGEDMDADGVIPAYLDWTLDISNVESNLSFQFSAAEKDMDNSNDAIRLYATTDPTNYGTAVISLTGNTLRNWGDQFEARTGTGSYSGSTLYLRLETRCDRDKDNWAVDNVIVSGIEISCTAVTVSADAPTVSLDSNGTVSISAGVSGADVTVVSTTGDCFTATGYEVSKTSSSAGFASSVSFDCDDTGSQNIWVRATDGSTTSAATATTVTVQDVTDPVAAAQNITVQLDANGVASITAGDIENGSTDNCSTASSSLDITSFSCSDVGSPVTVTLTVTDPGGNSDTATATVTVEDNVDPTIAAPATVNANTSSYGGTCSVPGSLALGSPTTADNCSVASVTNDAQSSYPVGTTVVTWTVTDGSGNTATATQNVVVTDDQLPTTPTFANTSFQLNMSSVVVGVSDLSISASDNCTDSGSLTYEISRDASTWGSTVSFGCADATGQFWPIYVRVTDAANNTSANGVGYATITDASLQAVGQNVTVSLAADGSYTLTAAEVDNGSSGNCGSSLSVSPNTFDCDDLGDNVVTLTVSDGSTSDATTVTVTIEDTTAPNVSLATSYSVDLGTDGTAGILPTDVATLTGDADACTPNGAVTFQIKRENGTFGNSVSVDCSDIGLASFNVVVTAIDVEGNAFVSGNIPVTVNDDEAPVISSISSGLTEVLSSAGTSTISASAYITASDNCTASGSLTYEISESSGSGFATTFAADCDDIGAKTFYFRVTDEATNTSAESSGTITIADNTDPTAVANDRVLILDGASVSVSASDSNFNGSTDNCTITSQVKLTSAGDETYASSLTFSAVGNFSVTLKVTDAGGNVTTDTATITVTSEPDEITLYTEDFEDDVFQNGQGSYPNFCVQGVNEAHDGNWTLGCGDGILTVYPVNSDNGFNWYSASGSVTGDWLSPSIDVSSILEVDATLDVSEAIAGGAGEGLFLYTILDGGSPVLQDSETGDFGTGTLDISGLSTASASSLTIKVSGMGSSGADLYLTDVSVTGTCIDLDSNGICDDDQNCVDVPAGTCGCTDVTACTYSSTASTNDSDSCQYVGNECLDPSGSTGYVWTTAGSTCSCTSTAFETVYFEDFGAGGEAGGQGAPYGYEGYTNLGIDGTDVINTSGESADGWALEFQYASILNGTLNGGEPDFFSTYYVRSGALSLTSDANVTDTVLVSNYTVNRVSWASKLLDVNDYSDAHLSVGLYGTQGTTADYVGARLGDNRMPFVWTSATGSLTEFTTFSKLIPLTVDTLRAQVDMGSGSGGAHGLDDLVVSVWGKEGCTDSNAASGYDATAQVDDGSCVYEFTTAYSRYDGGFQEKIWAGTACPEGNCGSAPYLDAKQVDANGQTSGTQFSYVISNGTTVTVNGTTDIDGDPTTKDLFVQDLTIKSGGVLVIPAGKRLRVMGTYKDEDGNGVTGLGMLCIDGGFEIPSDGPAVVTVQDFELPPGSSVDVADGKTLAIEGDLAFGDTDPASVSGLVELSGGDGQSISGDGATLDELQISNTAGVTVNDSLEIQGRLTLDDNTELAMGSNPLSFASRAVSGSPGGDKTAVLDAIPSNASITGPPARALQASNTDFTAEVERYFAPDGDGSTNWGYSMYGTSIAGVTASDLNDVGDFYSAGWPGSDYPNATSTVSFWNESTGSIEYASSASTSLTDRGCWVLLYGTQTPTFELQGTLNNHKIGGPSKVFSVTRQGPDTLSSGWNMLYNPYQARLDWDEVYESNSNSDVIEDQFLVFDTQLRRFRRYGKNTAGVQWSNDQEAAEDSEAMRYVNPGQGFWVRVKSGETSGSVELTPSMINNDSTAVDFIRNASAGEFEVLVEVENDNGANRMLLRFGAEGSTADYVEGDMSYRGSSNSSGESAFMVNGHKYVAKKLPLDSFDGDLFVRSRANMASTLRVVQVLGSPSICAHIEDHETGETMVLEAGAELAFTLPAHEAEAGRFTLHSTPFGSMEGRAPDCPESAAGSIVMEFGDAVADVVVTNYETMQVAAMLYQETGTVELDIEPGEYAVMVEAMEGTSMCRGGRRHVIVAPGEQPELLGLDPMPSDCNEGMASLAFELYGSGDYATTLMQGNTTVWSETLPAGEHLLQDIVPGDYVLSVQHACLEANEWVVLSDLGMPVVAPVYPFFTDAEVNGGAWLEATCMGCQTGEGYGYYWMMGEDVLGENAPLEFRVDAVGAYDLELVAFGPGCEVNLPFEMLVGKNKVLSPDEVLWGRVSESVLEVTLNSEWHNASLRWYDSSGRLLSEETKGAMLGTVRLAVPQSPGWLTLEVWNDQGQVARWSGIH